MAFVVLSIVTLANYSVAHYNIPEINKSIARHSPKCTVFHADFKNITFKAVGYAIADYHWFEKWWVKLKSHFDGWQITKLFCFFLQMLRLANFIHFLVHQRIDIELLHNYDFGTSGHDKWRWKSYLYPFICHNFSVHIFKSYCLMKNRGFYFAFS